VKIREYRDKGLTKKATARRLGLDRKTVAKYWKGPADDPEKPRYQRRPRLTDPYEEYITDRLDEWPELTAERIYREIKKKGYTGSERTVRRYVNGLRKKTYREYKPIETLPGEHRARLEMPPEELYDMYDRVGKATRDEVPVRLDDIWHTLQSSQYLRRLGCKTVETDRGDYIVVRHVPGIPHGTRITASRQLYEEGLSDGGPRFHFATYGDPVFDMLMQHMREFEFPSCIRRISVAPAAVDDVQVVGYVANCRDAAGMVSSRLITSWEQLQGLTLDLESEVTDCSERACRSQLQRIVNEEFTLCRSADSISDLNRKAAEANLILNHVLIETYLRERAISNRQAQFWHVDSELAERLASSKKMYLSGVPRSELKGIESDLLFDPGSLEVSDFNPMLIPAVHLRAAQDTARRVANAMKRPRSEITVGSVLDSVTKERGRGLRLGH
jgi:hypothetical protein